MAGTNCCRNCLPITPVSVVLGRSGIEKSSIAISHQGGPSLAPRRRLGFDFWHRDGFMPSEASAAEIKKIGHRDSRRSASDVGKQRGRDGKP